MWSLLRHSLYSKRIYKGGGRSPPPQRGWRAPRPRHLFCGFICIGFEQGECRGRGGQVASLMCAQVPAPTKLIFVSSHRSGYIDPQVLTHKLQIGMAIIRGTMTRSSLCKSGRVGGGSQPPKDIVVRILVCSLHAYERSTQEVTSSTLSFMGRAASHSMYHTTPPSS